MARPAKFERDEVLEKAMNAFWDRGYCATGVAELGAITGLRPGSLYGAFESKRQLFMEVLDRYGQEGVGQVRHTLSDSASPIRAIRSVFLGLAVDSSGAGAKRSCFLVNTALEVARHDKVIRARVNAYFKEIEALFRAAIERAQEQGELSNDKNAKAIAAFLIVNIWGLRVLGVTKPSYSRAKMIVSQMLSVLD